MHSALRSLISTAFLIVGLCYFAPQAKAQLGDPDLTTLQTLRDQYGWGKAFGWSNNTNPCPVTGANWNGITCDLGRVTIIVAICQSAPLNQPIPPILIQLTALGSLDIRNCGLFGPIPQELTTMTQLTRLRLDGNALSGTIPNAFGAFGSWGLPWFAYNRFTGANPDFGQVPTFPPVSGLPVSNGSRSAIVRTSGNFLNEIPPDWTVFNRDLSYNCYPQPLPASCSETEFSVNQCTPNRQDCPSVYQLTKLSGDGQWTAVNTPFPMPAVVMVSDLSNNPVAGVTVTFSGPGIVATSAVSDSNGLATAVIAANSVVGGNTVTASTDPNTMVTFGLTAGDTPACSPTISVTSSADSGPGTLRAALADVCPGGTVNLAPIANETIALSSQATTYNFSGRLYIGESVTILGQGATVSGSGKTRIFFVQGGNVNISNLLLENGLGLGGSSQYGGSGAGMGGAIFQNGGTLTLSQVAFSNNSAQGGSPDSSGNTAGGGFGGNLGGGDLGGAQGFGDGAGGVAQGFGGYGGFGGGAGASTVAVIGNLAGSGGGFGGGGGGTSPLVPPTSSETSSYAGYPGFGGGQSLSVFSSTANVLGGSGAGFGGAIFARAGTLNLQSVTFNGNRATGGTASSDIIVAQGKGGAVFVYSGATLNMDAATVFAGSLAAQAGVPSTGFSAAPYINATCANGDDAAFPSICGLNSNGTLCPGRDDADVCGVVSNFSLNGAPGSSTFQSTFQLFATSNSPATPSFSVVSGPCTLSGTTVTVTGANGSCVIQASWAAAGIYPAGTAVSTVKINPAAAACVAPPANLTAWYKGDGDANDNTGAYNATLGGDTAFMPGEVGQAFSFDGTQSPFIAIPAGVFPISGAPFSFEAWFQTSSGGVILGQQNSAPYANLPSSWAPSIYVGADGLLRAQSGYNQAVGVNPITSTYKINDGVWHHVALTYDGTTQILYLDGAPLGSLALSMPQVGTFFQLGTGFSNAWPNTPGNWDTFKGLIDEASIYSRALTPAEVVSIVNAGSNGKCNTESFYSLSGDNQTQVATRTLPLPFIVQTNNGAASVTFTVVPNNGAGGTWLPINGFALPIINGNSAVVNVDVDGYATSPQLTLNNTPGRFTVTANDGTNTLVFNLASVACTVNPPVTLTTDTGTSGELRNAFNTACAGSTIDLTQLSGTITLQSRIRIDDSLTLNGPGAATLAIDGNHQIRLFFVGHGNVSLNDLTLENGYAKGGEGGSFGGGGGAGMGGAIYQNGGHLFLHGVTLSNNLAQGGGFSASSAQGGGGFGGDASSCTGGSGGDLFGISGPRNSQPGAGAGCSAFRSLPGGFGGGGNGGTYVTASSSGGFGGGGGFNYFFNSAESGGFGGGFWGGGAGMGAAIFEYAGTLILDTVTLTGNQSNGGPGNSTNSGPAAQSGQSKGGALFVYASAGAQATTYNVTFSNNAAANAGANFIGSGSDSGYSNNSGCPGQDDVNICGIVRQVSLTGPGSAVYGSTFTLDSSDNAGSTPTLTVLSGPCSLDGNVVTVTGANGTCLLTAQWAATATYSSISQTIRVNTTQRPVTPVITARDKNYDGSLAATIVCSLQNVLAVDSANLGCTAASANFANAGPGNNIQVTATGITLTGSAASNYALSTGTATTTANINPLNITANVSITSGALTYNRLKGTGSETFTITNNSASTLVGPLDLLLVINGKATAVGNTGAYNSNPYWTAQAGPLEPGGSVSVTVVFQYVAGTLFTTSTSLYSGSL